MPYGEMGNKSKLESKFRIATAASKRGGYKNFSKGSPGAENRKKIAEAVARKINEK
jgi:hypothetical protein